MVLCFSQFEWMQTILRNLDLFWSRQSKWLATKNYDFQWDFFLARKRKRTSWFRDNSIVNRNSLNQTKPLFHGDLLLSLFKAAVQPAVGGAINSIELKITFSLNENRFTCVSLLYRDFVPNCAAFRRFFLIYRFLSFFLTQIGFDLIHFLSHSFLYLPLPASSTYSVLSLLLVWVSSNCFQNSRDYM